MKKLLMLLATAGFVFALFANPISAQEKDKKKKRDPEAIFKKLDKDGNGKLTLEEFKGKRTGEKAEAAEKRFKRLDKDGDGSVTLEEFKAAFKKKKKKDS